MVFMQEATLQPTPKTGQMNRETRFQLVQEIMLKLSSSLDLDEILNLIIDNVRVFVPYDAAAIYVLETRDGERRIRASIARGYPENMEESFRLKFGEGLVGWAIQTGSGIVIPDVRLDRRYVNANPRTLSEIVVPIVSNERVIGAFNLESQALNTYSETDLEVLTYFASIVAISIEKAFLHQERLEKKRMESELAVARQVQLCLLPDSDPKLRGFDISGANFSSEEISGDYFDFIPFPDNHLGIALADVSGKGVPSAMIMASFRASLRAQVRNDFAIRNVFRKVNYLLWESIASNHFVTAIYGVLDPVSRRFSFADAGHNPMILLRPDGSYQEISCGNTVLGLFEDRTYRECYRRLKPGELLVLYTDGATEATHDGTELGVAGLVKILRGVRHLPARDIVRETYDAIRDFAGKTVLDDDMTMVVIKVLPTESDLAMEELLESRTGELI